MNKFIKTKRFAESTQLSDEEMQAALARKNRWRKFKNFMKGLAGFGLGAAALYGGSKWYQNGGKGFVQNLMDRGADFTSKVGDATVDTAKGIATDTANEVNRGLDQAAASRLGIQPSMPNAVTNPFTPPTSQTPASQNVQVNDTIDQVNQEANNVLNNLEQKQEQQVAKANLHNGSAQNTQVNDQVNEVALPPEENDNKLDPQVLNKANNIYLSVSGSNDLNKLNAAINKLNALGNNPEIQNIVNNLQMKVDMITQSNQQVGSQIADYNNRLQNQLDTNEDYGKFLAAGLNPNKYGVIPNSLPNKHNISKTANSIYYLNNKQAARPLDQNYREIQNLNQIMEDLTNPLNKYMQ